MEEEEGGSKDGGYLAMEGCAAPVDGAGRPARKGHWAGGVLLRGRWIRRGLSSGGGGEPAALKAALAAAVEGR